MAIGERLNALLKEKNKKPGTLASETGISKNTIYSIIKRNNDKVSPAILERISQALDVPVDYFFGGGAQPHPDMRPVVLHRVPILGGAACGEPIYKPSDDTEYIDVDGDLPCDFALIAQGDSMTGDRICDGDVVFFRAQDDVDDGQIAAVIIDDRATLKRVYHIPGGVQLLSENPKYPPMIFTYPDHDSIRILGRAVSFLSAVR